jgi:hypothetical protein
MELVILLIALIALDIAALRWGCDSRESIDSTKWEEPRKAFFPTHHH